MQRHRLRWQFIAVWQRLASVLGIAASAARQPGLDWFFSAVCIPSSQSTTSLYKLTAIRLVVLPTLTLCGTYKLSLVLWRRLTLGLMGLDELHSRVKGHVSYLLRGSQRSKTCSLSFISSERDANEE